MPPRTKDERVSHEILELDLSWVTGYVVRKFREHLGYNRTELAAKIGASESSIMRWETKGKSHRPPNMFAKYQLYKMAQDLGFQLEDFKPTA